MSDDDNVVNLRERLFEKWLANMPERAAKRQALMDDLLHLIARRFDPNDEFVIIEALAIVMASFGGGQAETNGRTLVNILCIAIDSVRFEPPEFDAWFKAGAPSFNDKDPEVYDGGER
jgi:hypothetical protein